MLPKADASSAPPITRSGTAAGLVSDLAERLARRVERDPGGRLVVGLTGAPGSGKSTAARELTGLLAKAGALAGEVPMDGFHMSNAVLDELGRHGRKGAPDTFDVGGYLAALDRVRRGEEVLAPVYRRDLHEPVAAGTRVSGGGVVVTEGNYLALADGGWQAARERIDLLIMLVVGIEELAARLVARHMSFGRDRVAAAHWVRVVDLPNAALVEASAPRCDELWTCAPPSHRDR
ncbi:MULTISPECIES: phosphoribulokinase [Actinomyces]|uniref:phosphoribulokinase n=1 Tax=Actinomyces TaxID=1654 RepID=UPI001356D9C1|nr:MULTISPECIES: phosphoribulokinase [Actinomyces]